MCDLPEQAMAAYAVSGAASMLFTLPVEARTLFGVDTADDEVIEQFADFIINWTRHEVAADGGVTSALETALAASGLLESGDEKRR